MDATWEGQHRWQRVIYMPKIFLSHTTVDKPVVEPIALRLRDIFGQEKVFYDAWSIQPGQGIITRMNEGLEAPDFVFFFVSAASLKSKMVDLEWQNALYASTKGNVRIVPVRVDGSPMPPILMQSLWIDLHGQGIEVAIQQIVNVVQGNSTFTPQHVGFSNLTYTFEEAAGSTIITILASHLAEPNPSFALFTDNEEGEFTIELNGGHPFRSGFNKNVASIDGKRFNALAFAPLGGAVTPQHPMVVRVTQKGGVQFRLARVAHEHTHGQWRDLPRR
jgi:hypothetical protein